VDLTALEAIADLNVARRAVPKLFKLFADFYNITLPSRTKKMRVADVNGERRFEMRDVLYIPGQTHVNELPEVACVLHQVQVKQAAHRPVEFLFLFFGPLAERPPPHPPASQVAQWLLEDTKANMCYMADGANSQQQEILSQLLYRRDEETGRLDSRVISISYSPTRRRRASAWHTRTKRPSPRRPRRWASSTS